MVKQMELFHNKCIPELIYQYYGLAGWGNANVTAALDEFSQMPSNLIALSCGVVSHCYHNDVGLFMCHQS